MRPNTSPVSRPTPAASHTFCSASCWLGVSGGRPSLVVVLCPFSMMRAGPPCKHHQQVSKTNTPVGGCSSGWCSVKRQSAHHFQPCKGLRVRMKPQPQTWLVVRFAEQDQMLRDTCCLIQVKTTSMFFLHCTQENQNQQISLLEMCFANCVFYYSSFIFFFRLFNYFFCQWRIHVCPRCS